MKHHKIRPKGQCFLSSLLTNAEAKFLFWIVALIFFQDYLLSLSLSHTHTHTHTHSLSSVWYVSRSPDDIVFGLDCIEILDELKQSCVATRWLTPTNRKILEIRSRVVSSFFKQIRTEHSALSARPGLQSRLAAVYNYSGTVRYLYVQ